MRFFFFCSVKASTVSVNDLCVVFHGMRPIQARHYQVRHHHTSAQQYPRTSNPLIRDSADFAHRSSSHVRQFRRRPAAGVRSRLVDRVRGTHHECEMFVRTPQHVIVVSSTLILRVLRFETSLCFIVTCCDTWETPVASLEDPQMPFVSRSRSDLRKTAFASL